MSDSVAPPPPPGFQVYWELGSPMGNESSFVYAVLPIHWSIIRTPERHFRLINGSSDSDLFYSEVLPEKWKETVKVPQTEDEQKSIQFLYKDVSPGGEMMKVELIELRKDKQIIIYISVGSGDNAVQNRKEGGVVDLSKFLDIQAIAEGKFKMAEVYKMKGLWELEKQVHGILTGGKINDPYGSNIPKERLKELEEEEKRRKLEAEAEEKARSVPNPLVLPPTAQGRLPLGGSLIDPLRDLGRSDLDPFGGREIGIGGGMVMDPRGLRNRNPLLPAGMFPPGARFDPVGPPGGGGIFGPRRGGGLGGGGPRLPFAFPDPDHEQVPGGYEDMFS